MATTITYNGVSLQTSTIRTEKIEHVEMPRREINKNPRARANGDVYVSGWYGSRKIRVEGHIVAASAAALATALDTLQALLNSDGDDLVIGYAWGTRKYPDTVLESQDIPKESYHFSFVPFTLIFLVPGGVGEATAPVTEGDTAETSSPITETLALVGSADPLPVITIDFNAANTATVLRVKNDTTGEEIVIGPTLASFAMNDVVEIDCENMTVKLNSVLKDYTGIFPRWVPGNNDIRITVQATSFNLDWAFVYTPRYL